MNINGKYYTYKKENYDKTLMECIEQTCEFCISNTLLEAGEKINKPIMMLGKIQSGKTRAFTGLISLVFDNEFDIVFILTKNSAALVQQTVKRMENEFDLFISGDKSVVVSDIMKMSSKVSGYQLKQKNIIIAKKQQNNISKIIDFIEKYSISENKRCLIIDDEADTTGIGYEKNKETDEFNLRTVSSKVNEMRGTLDGCVFVQVTATPYALYLQPDYDEDSQLHAIKPLTTVLVPHGDEYIGGKYYFLDSREENHPASLIYEAMSDEEGELVSDTKRKGKKSKIDDRRSFKEEDILVREDKLTKFKEGIINFITGVVVLKNIYKSDNNKANRHYSYVIHTSAGKNSHFKSEQIAQLFLDQVQDRDKNTIQFVENLFNKSYAGLKKSVEKNGLIMPDYDIVSKIFYEYIDDGYFSIDVVNADNDITALLDGTNGELKLRTPCSIFIGGQILDRGVTIPNMIGFYYGRSPKTMQQDTVLQHSRMFGYRKDFLPVTRFYTTERIYSNMVKITEIDETLREDINQGRQGEGVYFITNQEQDKKFGEGNIKPCSPSKVLVSDFVLLKKHKRILPVGFTPVGKTKYNDITKKIYRYIQNNDKKQNVELKVEDAIELAKLAYQTIEDDGSGRFVNVNEFITSLKYLAKSTDKINILIRKDRNIKKYRENGNLIDSPEDGNSDLPEARKLANDSPSIILLQQNGDDSSWNYRSFWWPILIAQKNVPKTMYALKEGKKRVRS